MKLGKIWGLLAGGLCSLGFLASDAYAASWSVTFQINFLDTDEDAGGYVVFPVGGLPNNSTNDPANCVSGSTPVDRYFLYAAGMTSQEGRELVARTLLSAYLAGRPVRLNVSSVSGNCTSGKPVYGEVAIYP